MGCTHMLSWSVTALPQVAGVVCGCVILCMCVVYVPDNSMTSLTDPGGENWDFSELRDTGVTRMSE